MASSSSHFEPQITLITFQPAPRNVASSSWMTLPLPRTGPSRRCRLQFTTKTRLSSCSRLASDRAPSVSGSSHSPSPTKDQTRDADRVVQAAVVEVAVEPGVVDGGDRAEAHGDRRELPELRHQPRVGVRLDRPVAADLAAEVVEVLLVEPPLEEGPGVDAGCGMALEVDVVAGLPVVLAPEEVVEARPRRGWPSEAKVERWPPMPVGVLVGPDDHHGRVPADVGADAPLDVLVAREPGLLLGRDGVDVRRRDRGREADLQLAGPLEQRREEVAGAGLAVGVDDGVEDCRATPPSRPGRCPGAGGRSRRRSWSHSRIGCPWHDAGRLRPAPGCGRRPCPEITLIVYTDGACSGNPGPGGWAWAVAAGGPWASGGEAHTTNQRMEIQAALEALRATRRPGSRWSSDSTYVVNCFRDRWWEGWLRSGLDELQAPSRSPTATCGSRWSTLVRSREDEVAFRWVKGHSGDPMNDLVDRLAVEAAAKAAAARRPPASAARPPVKTFMADLAARSAASAAMSDRQARWRRRVCTT